MSKRGRPPKIPSQSIVDAILDESNRILIVDSVVEKGHEVWQEISANLNNSISPNSLYTYVVNNRFQVKSKLLELNGIVQRSDNPSAYASDQSDTSLSDDNDSDSSAADNLIRLYTIYFTPEEFQGLIEIKVRRSYRKGKLVKYKALKSGIWEDIINDRLVGSTKITCGFGFKTHYICADGNSGSFKGLCTYRFIYKMTFLFR